MEAVEQLAGTSHLLQAVAWGAAGDRVMSETATRTFLRCYADRASNEDSCLAHAQLAYSLAESQGVAAAEQVG